MKKVDRQIEVFEVEHRGHKYVFEVITFDQYFEVWISRELDSNKALVHRFPLYCTYEWVLQKVFTEYEEYIESCV